MAIELFCGSSSTRLCFAHANGFPSATYQVLLSSLAENFSVYTYEHLPIRESIAPYKGFRWQHFADDYIRYLETQAEPLWLMGHSLGATVSALVAAKRPDLCRGLVLLDPIFLPFTKSLGMRFAPRSSLVKMPMVSKALTRPESFSNHDEAFQFHRRARAFKRFDDAALWHYIRAAFESVQTGVRLRFPREWEAEVYMTAPFMWHRLSKVTRPTLGIIGAESDVIAPGMERQWRRAQPQLSLHKSPGGHLFPIEDPSSAIPLVRDFIQNHEEQASY